MHFDKLRIKNFKCFDEEGCSIEKLKSINVIIGKNNSGKSSIIELFKFLTTGDENFFNSVRNGRTPEVIFEHTMNDLLLIKKSFPENTRHGGIPGSNHFEYGLTFLDSILQYSLIKNGGNKFISVNKSFVDSARRYFDSYVNQIVNPLKAKKFSHLSAERDIQPEKSSNELDISTNGGGATNFVQQIINRDKYDSKLIELKLLEELNKIVNPDIYFSRILVQQNENEIWEIYFESAEDGRIPLSKMGSGIKTVLLVLILLHVKPIVEEQRLDTLVFALEELENNLHPSLQRRLYYYLHDFSKRNNCIFFLTTHSNVVIDLYSSLEDTQILHITKESGRTVIKSILEQKGIKKILDDLDVRASDIFQSNGIIWVEGPSDRTYINKWINLKDNSLIEGYHYSIMFYGGRLLSNLSFEYEFLCNELIPLLKLNRNSFVVIDRDGKTKNSKINETKTRIRSEIGVDHTWITKGREIENYITNRALENWLKGNYGITTVFKNESDVKLEESIIKIKGADKIKYNLNKNKYSAEIVEYIKKEDIDNLDLNSNLSTLIDTIKKWNKISGL